MLTIFFPKLSNSCNQRVQNFRLVAIVTFALSFTYTYSGARMKKEEHLSNQKCYLGSKWFFWYSKCSSFFTRRFLYILGCSGLRCGTSMWSSAIACQWAADLDRPRIARERELVRKRKGFTGDASNYNTLLLRNYDGFHLLFTLFYFYFLFSDEILGLIAKLSSADWTV